MNITTPDDDEPRTIDVDEQWEHDRATAHAALDQQCEQSVAELRAQAKPECMTPEQFAWALDYVVEHATAQCAKAHRELDAIFDGMRCCYDRDVAGIPLH